MGWRNEREPCFGSLLHPVEEAATTEAGGAEQNSAVPIPFCQCFLVTSTLTFAAAYASAGITVLIDYDLESCGQNHCVQFETNTGMAFVCCFTTLPWFLLNFWSLTYLDNSKH